MIKPFVSGILLQALLYYGHLEDIHPGLLRWPFRQMVAYLPLVRMMAELFFGMQSQPTKQQSCGPGHVSGLFPDGSLIASGSKDSTIGLWNTATGTTRPQLYGHTRSVESVAFSPDGLLIASGSKDETIRLWDTATGKLRKTSRANGEVTDLEFCKDGSCLRTNLGYFEIPSLRQTVPLSLDKPEAKTFLVENMWLRLPNERAIWLPADYRAVCSAVKGNTLALGHESGKVTFIEFRP
ncbi:hypothetical protein N7526_008920 [Penicillium atrosanguineum]|nr:hypothetical protein N7526_008920 [Penicillium atrosanguineum]